MHRRTAPTRPGLVRFASALLVLSLAAAPRADEPPDDEDEPATSPAAPEPAAPAPTPAPEPTAEPSTEPEASPEGTAETAPDAAPTPAERPLSGFWKGRSRVTLLAGQHFGGGVRDAGILAAPITGQPGSRDYPARSPLSVDLDDAPIFGVRYAWLGGDKWGLEVGLSQVASRIVDPNRDLVGDAEVLTHTSIPEPLQIQLLERLDAHSRPHDIDVTFIDFSALHVFNPKKRFPIELSGGLGWALSSLDGPVAYERLVASDAVVVNQFVSIANEMPDASVPFGQCLADNDPCIELKAQGGLTWNAGMTVGYAFTRSLQLKLGARLRFVEQLVDPGDSGVMKEVTLGLSFHFGG